ncbi:MAG: hypothetical protein PSN44_06060 [Gammaproteobacteria bacterium]|nr:hypothetical protein [Gammaproteobacteria bacterium]
MKSKIVFISLLSLFLIGCVDSASVRYGDSKPHYKHAPPPHAPAHGYRHNHKKHDMSYDSGLSVYVVLGLTDHYFDNGIYYRYRDGAWQVSASIGGHWENTVNHAVPSKLFKSKMKELKHQKKHHNKGKGKDKKKKWDND